MTADFVARYARFDQGDWGNTDPARAGDYSFYGENMLVYDSELLGPRPGLAQLDITGLTHPIVPGPNGFDIWQNNLVIVAQQPYLCPFPADRFTNDTWTSMGTFAQGAAVGQVRFAEFNRDLYMTVDGYLYKYSSPAGPLVQITTPFPIDGIARWGYYLVAWDTTVPKRLWYSEVTTAGADPDVWGANAFLDVGGNEPITALMAMYNYLYVGKQSGWYAVSGVLADRPRSRRVTIGNGPIGDSICTSTTDNRILYWGQGNVPMWFNGESSYLDKSFRVRGFDVEYPCDAVAASVTGRSNVMLGEPTEDFGVAANAATRMLIYDQGRWTTHAFNTALGGVAGHEPRTTIDKPADKMFFVNRPFQIGDDVEVYAYDLALNRPGRATDPWSCFCDLDSGIPVQGYLEFPAYYDPQSRAVLVRNIVVQLRHWPGEAANQVNELQLQVRPLGRREGQPIEDAIQVWSMPADVASDQGSDEVWSVGVGDIGWSAGFQIIMPHIHGVEIRAVEVHCEVRTARL